MEKVGEQSPLTRGAAEEEGGTSHRAPQGIYYSTENIVASMVFSGTGSQRKGSVVLSFSSIGYLPEGIGGRG